MNPDILCYVFYCQHCGEKYLFSTPSDILVPRYFFDKHKKCGRVDGLPHPAILRLHVSSECGVNQVTTPEEIDP